MIETDVPLGGGRILHVYDTGPDDGHPVLWHHGTPNVGAPPAPLFPAGERLGLRWVAYDRPGYGPSTPQPGRTVASAAGWATAVADALDLERFALAAHSGGSPHALATAALLPDRVTAVLAASGLAPYDADGLDWHAGMAPAQEASVRASAAGRAAKEAYERDSTVDDPGFTPADHAALAGVWSWFLTVVQPALAAGIGPLVDDELAYVAPWGADPAVITAPVVLLHGEDDRIVPASHSRWLAGRIPGASLRVVPGAGHISVLESAEDELAILVP